MAESKHSSGQPANPEEPASPPSKRNSQFAFRGPLASGRGVPGPVVGGRSRDERFGDAMRKVELMNYDARPAFENIQGLLVKALTELENLRTRFAEIQDEWRRSS